MPGGWAADRFGGKWLVGGCVLLSSVISLLTPAAARIHIGLLISLRVLAGLGEGVMMPAIYAMIARWSAPQYHSMVASIIFIGADSGIIAGGILSGVLCDYGFADGWPSVFYVFGMAGCLWSVLWSFLCYNSPQTHPRISTAELQYWERVIDSVDSTSRPPTPWREIFTSAPVWALSVSLFADDWCYFTLSTCLPLFMHDVLGVNMTRNGAFSTIPFVATLFTLPAVATLVDWLRSPGRLLTTFVRKVATAVGFTLAGCFLVMTGYVGCNRTFALVTITGAVVGSNMAFSTEAANQLDLAPLHAGKIMGLAFTVANLGAIGGPLAVGVMTSEQSTRSEWQSVFWLSAGINVVGAIVFVVFGSGERQSWAD